MIRTILAIVIFFGLLSNLQSKSKAIVPDSKTNQEDKMLTVDCANPNVVIEQDSSLLASASQETEANPCLFAGCAVIF